LDTTPNNSSSSLVNSPTPPPSGANSSKLQKDRNSRKTCGYCHKDFHEMSLKRHIKDVHFRSQNTYVICPQCCKQYASQNSLYSHLNRVHGVKKEMLADMQLQMVTVGGGENSGGGGGSSNASNASSTAGVGQQQQQQEQEQPQQQQLQSSVTPTPGGSRSNNHHEEIMDLAHHSDSSN
jgi:uncharacterized C2H2 Zn-finger protein